MVSPPPNLRRSPRGNVKGQSAPGSATVVAPSTSASSISWAQNAQSGSSNLHRTTTTRGGGSFFSAGALDSALSLSQHQPSTSQGAGLGAILTGQSNPNAISNPTVKLNKSILNSSALATASTDNNVVNINLVHGSGSSAGSSNAPLQGFSGQNPGQAAAADPDAEDADVGRLQALLEARGIPPHVFGSLGKFYFSCFWLRVFFFVHRSYSSWRHQISSVSTNLLFSLFSFYSMMQHHVYTIYYIAQSVQTAHRKHSTYFRDCNQAMKANNFKPQLKCAKCWSWAMKIH